MPGDVRIRARHRGFGLSVPADGGGRGAWILDYMCSIGMHQEIYFLWRAFLRDPSDEMVLEVAVGARADAIVTHNIRDFEGVEERFGIRVATPGHFLVRMEDYA